MSRWAAAWAGFLVTLLVAFLHAGVALAQLKPSAPDARRAKALFEEGVALVDEGKWADALAAFQKSDAINPSASARLNIAVTLRALGRYVEAKRTLDKILDDARTQKPPLKPKIKSDVEKLLKEVAPKILSVTVQVTPPDGDVQMDGALLTIPPDGKISIDPGKHVFVVQGDGYDTATITQTLTTSGAVVALVAPKTIPKIEVVKETPFYARAWFIATAAVAVAGGATVGIIFATRPKETPPAGPPQSTVTINFPAAVRF
jgi:tetratricopeptide (TPR) repeat protein